jgi:hypothetical protein
MISRVPLPLSPARHASSLRQQTLAVLRLKKRCGRPASLAHNAELSFWKVTAFAVCSWQFCSWSHTFSSAWSRNAGTYYCNGKLSTQLARFVYHIKSHTHFRDAVPHVGGHPSPEVLGSQRPTVARNICSFARVSIPVTVGYG